MSEKNHEHRDRRALLGGLGAAALAGVALAGTAARAQTASGRFEAQRHALDAWLDALPGTHRVFIDTDITAGGVNALRYAMNLMNSHVAAYQGNEADMAIVICYRHASTPLGYNDALWAKYGKTFATLGRMALKEGEAAPSANPQMTTLAAHAEKGMHFAVCNSASTMIAGVIARESGQKPEDVLAELTANLIPNGHMVPAGVMAVTRAQEYGYSFLYSSAT
jgi:intracellular sulfur oxidation DsrE/DsrF family protein